MGCHQADAAEQPRGAPRVNDRRVLNGIFRVLRSGAPWPDLPDIFGPYIFIVQSNFPRTSMLLPSKT